MWEVSTELLYSTIEVDLVEIIPNQISSLFSDMIDKDRKIDYWTWWKKKKTLSKPGSIRFLVERSNFDTMPRQEIRANSHHSLPSIFVGEKEENFLP